MAAEAAEPTAVAATGSIQIAVSGGLLVRLPEGAGSEFIADVQAPKPVSIFVFGKKAGRDHAVRGFSHYGKGEKMSFIVNLFCDCFRGGAEVEDDGAHEMATFGTASGGDQTVGVMTPISAMGSVNGQGSTAIDEAGKPIDPESLLQQLADKWEGEVNGSAARSDAGASTQGQGRALEDYGS